MNIDKYFMWIQYERLHNHSKAKHNKTVCIILWICCIYIYVAWYNHRDFFRDFIEGSLQITNKMFDITIHASS